MGLSFRNLPDIVAWALSMAAHARLYAIWAGRMPHHRRLVRAGMGLLAAWVTVALLLGLPEPGGRVPHHAAPEWIRGLGATWGLFALGAWVIEELTEWLRRSAGFDPGRRRIVALGSRIALAAPAAAVGYGIIAGRSALSLVEVDIPIRGLARDLDGLRIVQITDIHFGPFFGERDLRRAVAMANQARAHVALVTGDLVTVRDDALEDCLKLLAGLRSEAGVFGCMGNHELVAGCESELVERASRMGHNYLRRQNVDLRFGQARLSLAGVDYQRKRAPYLVGAERLVQPGRLNILLSHNPDVFPVAAGMGYDLTIAGHTHGGQVRVEVLPDYLNPGRFYTRYVHGRYEREGKHVYVSRGLGTVGVPVRVGAPPEVSLIRLCAT